MLCLIAVLLCTCLKVDAGKSGKTAQYSHMASGSSYSSVVSSSWKSSTPYSSLNNHNAKGKGGKSTKSGKGYGPYSYSTSKSIKGSEKASSKGAFYGSGAPNGGVYTGSVKGITTTSNTHQGSQMSNGIAIGWYFFPDLNVWYFYGYNDPFSSGNSGPYTQEDGSSSCFSNTETFEGIEKKKMNYKYQFESYGGSLESQLSAIEVEFANVLNAYIDCSSARRLLILSRQLKLVGVDSSPADSIQGVCGSGCYRVDGSMTVSISSDTSQDELCNLSAELVKYADTYEPGSVNNVSKILINAIEADGYKCYEVKDVVTPTAGKSQEESSVQATVFPWYYPFVALVVLVVVSAMFFQRRNRIRRYHRLAEIARIEGIRSLEEENKRYGAGYHKQGAINTVNVHKCNSGSCATCTTTSYSTEFIPLDGIQDWIKRRIRNDLKAVDESNELDLNSTFDVDYSEDDISSPPIEEYPDDEK